MKKGKDIKQHIEFDLELRRNPYSGLYIAFEGIDGSGKSTQVGRLEEYFNNAKKDLVTTSEPRREGPVGKLIHQILQGMISVPPVSLQYLYTADRIINHHDIIEPALKKGATVISHRCLWSNLPYGMLDKKMTDYNSNDARIIDVVHGLLSLYNQFIIPDITFYLKVSPDTAMKRLVKIREVKEIYEKKEKLEKVAAGYEWEVKQFPDEFVVIDAEKNEDEVFEQIKKYLEGYKK